MRISRWSKLSVDRVCQEHDVMREADANKTSGDLGSAVGGRNSRGCVTVKNIMVRSVD